MPNYTWEEVDVPKDEEALLVRRVLFRLYQWLSNQNATTRQNLLDAFDQYRAVLQGYVRDDTNG